MDPSYRRPDDEETQESLDNFVKHQPMARPRPRFGFSRTEKMALFANGVIWTLVIWTALIFVLIQDGPAMWLWLVEGTAPVRAAPLAPPTASFNDWLAPASTVTVRPTGLPTRVVAPTGTPAPPAMPIEVSPQETGLPLPEIFTPATPGTVPTIFLDLPSLSASTQVQVEAAAITIPQADEGQPTPVPWPPPADPPPTLTPRQVAAQPGRIVIDSVGIDAPISPVGWQTVERDGQLTSAWEVADSTVGWHLNSALPGEPGNTVLSGHSNIGGEVFRSLAGVSKGDEIVVQAGGQSYRYEISLTTVVKEAGEPVEVRLRNAEWIAPTTDERLTLVTCWPYPYSTHRFIVVAQPAP
jgi:sortase A